MIPDTEPRLGICNRCRAYVLLAVSSGFKAAADVAPADRDAYIAAVAAGRGVYDLAQEPGRPRRLRARTLAAPVPGFDAQGAQTGAQGVHVEHACTQPGPRTFTEVEHPPHPAPVTPGGHRGGSPRGRVHESGLVVEEIPRFHAKPVSRHRSEATPKCDICSGYIVGRENFTGIQHGTRWVWAIHEECP